MLNRRSFLGCGAALAAAGCTSLSRTGAPVASRTRAEGDWSFGRVPFRLGVAGFTFHRKNLDDTLAALEKLDVHYLCIKDFHLPLTATDADIKAFHAKCADRGVTGYAVGPIYMDSGDFARRAFDYAAHVGVKTLVGVPWKKGDDGKQEESRALCECIDGLVKEYGIRYAIHNHGPDMPRLFPNAEHGWEMVKDLDPRMGLCLDVGHQFRFGWDPVAAIEKYHARIFDVHIKNVTFDKVKNLAQPAPRGDMDVPAVFRALKNVGFDGVCSIEYERDFDDNFAGLAESVGYFRGVIDAIG